MSTDQLSPSDFRAWLDARRDPPALKEIAFQAIACFERATLDNESAAAIEELFAAAIHPRFVVWEVALPLLAQLAQSSLAARKKIEILAASPQKEWRRRAIQYLNDFFPRDFCVKILSSLLGDRSAQVREFSASRIEGLGLTELLPNLEQAWRSERNSVLQEQLECAYRLLRDDYIELERSGYVIAFRNADTGPNGVVWISSFENEPLTPSRVRELGVDKLRRMVLEAHSFPPSRPWAWPLSDTSNTATTNKNASSP